MEVSPMKKTFVLTLMLLLSIISCRTYAATRGVIVYYEYPKMVIATNLGYTYGDVYSYALVYPGYYVFGELEMYGFYDIYCPYTDTIFTMWIENFWASRQRAQDWINNGY